MSGKYLGSWYVIRCDKEVHHINKNCSGLSDKINFYAMDSQQARIFKGKRQLVTLGKLLKFVTTLIKHLKTMYL